MRWIFTVLLLFVVSGLQAQERKKVAIDSAWIGSQRLQQEVRFAYGMRGNSLVYESLRSASPDFQGNLYRNISDFAGIGLKYKWFDADFNMLLAGTTYLREERSNLDQVNLSFRFTTRRFAFRASYTDSHGVVVASDQDGYVTPPNVSESRTSLQGMYFLNSSRYSYRAALYQSEIQRRSAGSWLMGVEVFYRSLSAQAGLTAQTYDNVSRFGEQSGMQTLQAPGLLLSPGYAYTKVWKEGTWFLSGLLSAGAGVAFNRYEASSGTYLRENLEAAGSAMISGGYNGPGYYVRLLVLGYGRYELIDPAFLTSTSMSMDVMVGYRFR